MRWIDLLRMSIQSLKKRRLRTFLTVLGVVIGTASIVVMISIGFGMQQSVFEQIRQSGGLTGITVSSSTEQYGMRGERDKEKAEPIYATDETLTQIRHLAHVRSAEPVVSIRAMFRVGKYTAQAELKGMTPEGLRQQNIELESGSRLPDGGAGVPEVLFGNFIMSDLMEESTGTTPYWEMGQMPDVDLLHDQIFMILDMDAYYSAKYPDARSDASAGEKPRIAKKYVVKGSGIVAGGVDMYTENAYSVLCDLETLRSMLKKEFAGRLIPGQPTGKNNKPLKQFVYNQILVQADDVHEVEDVAAQIRSMGYTVTTNAEALKSIQREYAMVQAVLGGIGAISLIVAAIGIANTMMMSIYERTKEIGVMKVIGCSLANIRQMFLMEAAFIGLLGGVCGNILSFVMSAILNKFLSGRMGMGGQLSYIPLWLPAAAIGFAVFVGMLAGYFPARRAMRLSPLTAIRGE